MLLTVIGIRISSSNEVPPPISQKWAMSLGCKIDYVRNACIHETLRESFDSDTLSFRASDWEHVNQNLIMIEHRLQWIRLS